MAAREARADKDLHAEKDRRVDAASPAADPDASRVDRRVARSRAAILGAFEKLLGERPLAQITVSAIAAIRDNLLLNRRLVENLPADDLMSRVRGSLEREISARRLLPNDLTMRGLMSLEGPASADAPASELP